MNDIKALARFDVPISRRVLERLSGNGDGENKLLRQNVFDRDGRKEITTSIFRINFLTLKEDQRMKLSAGLHLFV